MSHTSCGKDPTKPEYNRSYQAYKEYHPKNTVGVAEGVECAISRCDADLEKNLEENKRTQRRWENQNKVKGHRPNQTEWTGIQAVQGEYNTEAIRETLPFGFKPSGYVKPNPSDPGFDHVWEGDGGKFGIADSKGTSDVSGTSSKSLKYDEEIGAPQMSMTWVMDRLNQMLTPGKPAYRAENVELAQRIMDAGPENIIRLVSHTHPLTGNITVSIGNGDTWIPIQGYRPIEK